MDIDGEGNEDDGDANHPNPHMDKKQKMEHTVPVTLSPLSYTSPSPTHTAMIAPGVSLQSTTNIKVGDRHDVSVLDGSSSDTPQIVNREDSSPHPSAVVISTRHKSHKKSSASPYSFSTSSSSSSSKRTDMTLDQVKYCGAIMRNLKKHRDAVPFIHPVDYIKLNVPDYPYIIKRPIDLTTIDKKLKNHDYNHVNQFVDDIRLLFNNCYKFNGPEATVSMLCQNVESAFEKSLRQMPPSKQANGSSPVQQHQATSLPPGITPSFRRITEDNKPKQQEIQPPLSSDYLPKKHRTVSQNGVKPSSSASRQLKFCGQALREMKKIKYRAFSYPFLLPVDAVALNLPDYHTIITQPMDISTIEQNLARGEYDSPLDFESDVRLMFANCYRYNPPTLPIHKMAKDLERIFDAKWKQLPAETLPRKPDSSSSSDDGSDDAHDGKSSTRLFPYSHAYPSTLFAKTKEQANRIAELERHLASLSQQIATIKSSKRKAHKLPAKPPAKQKPRTKKEAPKPQRRPSLHRRPDFTFEQKKKLSESINSLAGDQLNTVVGIIQSSMPHLDGVSLS